MDNRHSFAIRRPRDLLGKLKRERDRFIKASSFNSDDHKFQYDHAINFAYTAWHLVDWVWRYLEMNGLDVKGVTGYESFNEFHNGVRSECLGLQICYEITNGNKHFHATRLEEPIVLGTKEEVYGTEGIGRPAVRPAVRPVIRPATSKHHADIKVVVDGKGSLSFSKLCDQVYEYWDQYFQSKRF